MTARPYLLQLPDPDQAPGRYNPDNGSDTYVVMAESAADALAMVQNYSPKLVWANVVPQPLFEADDMFGWSMRVVITKVSDGSITAIASATNASTTADVAATGSYTFSSTSAANGDSVTINGQAVSWVTSGATGFELNVTGNPTTDGANLAALVNQFPDHFAVTASAALGVVTLTAIESGVQGNAITTVKSGTNIAVSGATLSGGTSSNDLNALAALLVTALNGTGVIAHASYAAPTLTVAGAADNIGDHAFQIFVTPPGTDNSTNGSAPNVGVPTRNGVGVPGFIVSITDKGSASAALTATLASDSYGVPEITVRARVQE